MCELALMSHRKSSLGYSGRKAPRLAGEKRGDRWVIAKEEAERFIREHGEENDA
jgi:hypothetical protein